MARTREFDRCFDRLGAGIGEEDLVEIGREREQPLGQQAGKDRQVHLHEIGQIAVEHAVQGFAQPRMVAADREDAPAAEEIEIAVAGAVVEILPVPLRKPTSKPIVCRTRTIISFMWRECRP